jgi:hypothetical protein
VEREYLGDIHSGALVGGSSEFNLASYSINPGLPGTFPWLSTIAQQFDQWQPNGIVFEFRSTSSDYNGTSQALGVVVLATDYDSMDNDYASKIEMENSDYAMSVKAADGAVHGVECDMTERPTRILYTRTTDIPANTDARMYDLGKFQIATKGMSAADVNVGELWVSYDITFYKKQLAGALGKSIYSNMLLGTTGISTSNYFGTDTSVFSSSLIVQLTGDTVLLEASQAVVGSRFHVSYWCVGSSATVVIPTFTLFDCRLETAYPQYNTSWGAGAGGTYIYHSIGIVVTGPAPYFQLVGGTLPVSPIEARLYVDQTHFEHRLT